MTLESTRQPIVNEPTGVFTEFASKRFGVPVDNVTPAMRKAAKDHFICSMYGGSV
jgi:hypothetical protein